MCLDFVNTKISVEIMYYYSTLNYIESNGKGRNTWTHTHNKISALYMKIQMGGISINKKSSIQMKRVLSQIS